LLAAAGVLSACTASDARPPGPRVLAGNGSAGFADGWGAQARFHKPIRLAALSPDSVAVADIYNHAIREVRLDGRVRTLVGGPDRKGHQDGPAEEARIESPHGVAVAADGRIAVAEASGHTLRQLTPIPGGDGSPRYVVSTLAGARGQEGLTDGPASTARFNSPHAALWARDGSLFVPDIGNARVRRLADGVVETVAGSEPGTFVYPMDLALAPDGTLLIADAGANLVRTWSEANGVGTLRVQGALRTPHGIAAAPDGTVYVAEMNAHQVVAIGPDGHATRVAGTGEEGAAGDQLRKPAAVLVHAGHLWVADLDNHRIVAVPLP